MNVILGFLLLANLNLAFAEPTATRGVIEATIIGTNQTLDVALLLRDQEVWKQVGRRLLPASSRSVLFDDLPSGVYEVLVRGNSGLEQLATKVVIGQGDLRRVRISIHPTVIRGHVRMGGTGLIAGVISLRLKDSPWLAAIRTDRDGAFHFPLWERGTYVYSISAPSITTTYSSTIKLNDASSAAVLIEVPTGHVEGTVRDAKSGAPVTEASVMLQTVSTDGEQHARVSTDLVGRFYFNALRFGRCTLRVISARHLEPPPIFFDLQSTKQPPDFEVRVESGRTIPVVVMDANNQPVAGATVFAVAEARRRSRAMTDENGSTSIAVPENEVATLFAIPAEKSFSAQRITHPDSSLQTLRLPRALSSLRIRAHTTDGRPMPRFSLMMRFNGELMPPEVADELMIDQGLQFTMSETHDFYLKNIPSGRYEFWPYRTTEEAESILAAGSDVMPPIQIDVRAGENAIDVTFAAR